MLLVSVLVGLLDGFGLAMFLPLLELISNPKAQAMGQSMGNLQFLIEGLQSIGLQLTLTVVLMTMLSFFFLKGIAKWLETYLNVIFQQYFIRKMRIENINALSNYSYQAFVAADAGEIQNTLSGEVQRVVQAYRMYSQMLRQGVLVLSYTGLAFFANPEFAILVFIGGVLSNFLFSFLYKKTKLLSQSFVQSNHYFQGLLIQKVAFFKYLKATGSVRLYAKNLKDIVNKIEDTVRRMGVLDSIMTGVREPMMMAVVVGTILVQVNLLGGSLATIILSLLFFYRALNGVTQLQTAYNRFLSFSGSIDSLQKFVIELKQHREYNGHIIFGKFKNAIQLKNLSFSYNSGDPFLKNINLKIVRNETLAIVGESGSGKTTLMNILSGLLKTSHGHMLVDDNEINELDKISFQRQIGYITQEPVIFDDTIFNNVTFWAQKTETNLRRFWEAMNKANITTFVEQLKDNEESRLGNNGINLSGGQKQRISIARELYKDVDFLFMDEATSALDSETERAIQENINQLKGRYTILIIAHRLSTIKNADRVVVMKDGCIDRIGSYTELLNDSKAFRRMVELQEV